jgi:hypothetical protein
MEALAGAEMEIIFCNGTAHGVRGEKKGGVARDSLFMWCKMVNDRGDNCLSTWKILELNFYFGNKTLTMLMIKCNMLLFA